MKWEKISQNISDYVHSKEKAPSDASSAAQSRIWRTIISKRNTRTMKWSRILAAASLALLLATGWMFFKYAQSSTSQIVASKTLIDSLKMSNITLKQHISVYKQQLYDAQHLPPMIDTVFIQKVIYKNIAINNVNPISSEADTIKFTELDRYSFPFDDQEALHYYSNSEKVSKAESRFVINFNKAKDTLETINSWRITFNN